MEIREILNFLEEKYPLKLQEHYDNSGLIIGSRDREVSAVMICLDCTREVLEEAIEQKCNLILSHHPVIFDGLKKINPDTQEGKIIYQAIKNDISIYAIHTNIDNHIEGLNSALASKLGLINCRILSPAKDLLKKIVTFCPVDHADKVRSALFEAGAGQIGNYDSCSYNINGEGSFKPLENTNPFVGERGKIHFEKEVRIETIFPVYKQNTILEALLKSHPYEEVAYDIYPLDNSYSQAGAGIIGELPEETDTVIFLQRIKEITKCGALKYSKTNKASIKRIAVCTGSGGYMIRNAMDAKADILITADLKYHTFVNISEGLIIVDAGHYETEQFIKELLYAVLNKNFPTFAFLISEKDFNPVNYL